MQKNVETYVILATEVLVKKKNAYVYLKEAVRNNICVVAFEGLVYL